MGGLAMQNTKQKKSNFRASAVPLVTVDPYFSVWSFSDTLYGDATRHWTGRENRMNAGIIIDNTCLLYTSDAADEL